MNNFEDREPQRRRTPSGDSRSTGPRPRQRTASQPGRGSASRNTDRRRPAAPARGPRPPARKRKRPALRIAALLLAFLFIALAIGGCTVLTSITNGLPDPSKPLKGTDLTTTVLDRNGKTITKLFAEQNREYVELKEIPKVVQEAVIATEDERFYEHQGVDFFGMLRALWVDIRAGAKLQGGSTITQQYVKQAFVGDESSIKRKVSEAILAYRLEKEFSKDKILEMYLNTIYFGHGAYSIQTASQAYFGKNIQDVTLPEAAMLAGVIKSPGRFSPYLQPENAKDRRATVLAQMLKQGFIDQAQHDEALASPIKTAGLKQRSSVAPYFIEYVKAQLVEKYGEDAVYRGGLTVSTTLDLSAQKAAEKAVTSILDKKSDPSAAVVSIDPKTGEIVAMVGGRDFTKWQYNVAVQGHRQSGSAFKPFVLVTALEDGISPEATYTANSTRLKIPGGQTWSVAGEPGYKGAMRLRPATWHSINPVFAQVVLKVGADEVVKTAHELGITTTITPVPAVALGGMAEGVTPLEMASAYGTLANGGVRTTPFGIAKVTDKTGKVLFQAKKKEKRVIEADIAYLTTDILKGVITSGTGSAASIGRPAAGKTGTTQLNSDAWFVGYTPDLATAVWVGYPDSKKSMNSVHGIKVTGGSFPARIWSSFMRSALKKVPASNFKRPAGLTTVKICAISGQKATELCPKTATGLFLNGTEPDSCTLHTTGIGLKLPKFVGMTKVEAIAKLDELGVRYDVVEAEVGGVEAGIVSAQTPRSGSKITSGTIVTLTVSTGGLAANKPPTASFSFTPVSPSAGATVKFDASASADSDGSIAKWVWEFGDGSKDASGGKSASHKFSAPGTYGVTLWITDDKGATVSITRNVVVK